MLCHWFYLSIGTIMCEKSFNSGKIGNEAIEQLSSGLIEIYHPKLKIVNKQLHELTEKQEFLLTELHSENLKFSQARHSVELLALFKKIKQYRDRLAIIRKNMIMLHEMCGKLKKRALKLEQQKQREALEKINQRENEEQLIGLSDFNSMS